MRRGAIERLFLGSGWHQELLLRAPFLADLPGRFINKEILSLGASSNRGGQPSWLGTPTRPGVARLVPVFDRRLSPFQRAAPLPAIDGNTSDLGIILAKRAKLLFQAFGFLAECGATSSRSLKSASTDNRESFLALAMLPSRERLYRHSR